MAVTQSSQIVFKVSATLASTDALAAAQDTVNLDYTQNFGNGAGAGAATEIYRAQRTLSASGTEDLDLSGVLLDALGATVALTKVKAIIIHAAAGNTNNVKVGAGNTTCLVFGATTHYILVKPGGSFAIIDPSAAGITVTNSSADLLTITNSAGTTGVTYDIVVLGA